MIWFYLLTSTITGELIAITRFISPEPATPLGFSFTEKRCTKVIGSADLFEIQTESGTSYYATVENADQMIVLKSEGSSGWQIFQKEKKANAE